MKRLIDEEIIANAQAQGRFLTESEMQKLSAPEAAARAARRLEGNSAALVEGAASEVFRTSSSDSRSFTSAEQVQYTRGIEFCLRLITYGLIASSADLDEIAKDLSKNFRVLKLESKYLLIALQYIGSNHGLTGEEAREVNICINHLSNVVSAFESESRMNILKQLQEHFARIAPGVSLADELIAERREEARRELGL
jgi:Phycobilisome protein